MVTTEDIKAARIEVLKIQMLMQDKQNKLNQLVIQKQIDDLTAAPAAAPAQV